ncbi:hypothetical protein [Mesorhizobium sp. GbtcB19]|uniref:hypothetical protein n=1 Tax=Mesorhizobium sp. GbtcB19 TaxID=2824764 RepID=UPI001C30060A|nr:hypothetical protein [Mesorhizobium sp. GbtcB19]
MNNAGDGNLTLLDRGLFLLFVKLERAQRLKSFEAVEAAVQSIERCTNSIGKRHLALFAYAYVYFSDGTPKMTERHEILEGEGVRKVKEYRRAVTDEEIAIAVWAQVKLNRYESSFRRALHAHPR